MECCFKKMQGVKVLYQAPLVIGLNLDTQVFLNLQGPFYDYFLILYMCNHYDEVHCTSTVITGRILIVLLFK